MLMINENKLGIYIVEQVIYWHQDIVKVSANYKVIMQYPGY